MLVSEKSGVYILGPGLVGVKSTKENPSRKKQSTTYAYDKYFLMYPEKSHNCVGLVASGRGKE